jgi:hypothetical protein
MATVISSSVEDPNYENSGHPNQKGTSKTPKPRLLLPSATHQITWSAQAIFRILATMRCMFVHAGVVVELAFTGEDRAELREVTAAMAQSRFEYAGELWQDGKDNKGKPVSRPSRCSEAQAKSLLSTREATEILPPIRIVSPSPILVLGADGKPRILDRGYHSELGGVFVVNGKVKQEMPLEEAVDGLLGLIREYKFKTPDDKARAVAALITPAFVYGQLLDDAHVPMILVEANNSQAGKGLLLEIITAIYGEQPRIVVARNGGVGGSDEDFNAALLRGCPFITLDNLKGSLNSPHIEAFLTAGGPFMARTFRRAPVDVDPRRYIVLATSNGFESTVDLDNRMIRINICKRRGDYNFTLYNEELLDLIRERRSFYVGCVFSIVAKWIADGRPRTEEMRHTFRRWAQSVDWILVHVFKDKLKGRLMDYDAKTLASRHDLASTLGFTQPE